MSTYEEQRTNDMTNPFNPNHSLKQKLIEDHNQDQDYSNSNTIPIPPTNDKNKDFDQTMRLANPKLPQKIKPSLTFKPTQLPPCFKNLSQDTKHLTSDQPVQQQDILSKTHTHKNPRANKIICEVEQQNFTFSVIKQQPKGSRQDLISKAEQSPTTESAKLTATILTKPNLRQKFTHLLPPIHQRTLSSQQLHLITIMSMIDQTMEYSMKNRNTKFIFFQDLKKIIRDSLKVIIDFRHLEQLLYLDQALYQVKWETYKDKKKYDIIMKLPEIKSKQVRKNNLRETIVEFLMTKHDEFLKAKGMKNFIDNGKWHDDFIPHNYQIPRLSLPPHPQTKSAQLRCFDDSKINAIKNQKVKELFRSEKQKSQIQSFAKQQSSMQMIFAGTSAQFLQQRLVAAVKQREEQTKLKVIMQVKQLQKQKTQVTPDTLKGVAEILLKAYTSKNVSNMFKMKVIEILKERTNNKYGDLAINRHLDHLLEQKAIGFLKEVATRDGNKILQINIAKYKDVLAHVQEMRDKLRAAESTI